MRIIKERSFYKQLLTIAVPIGIQNIIALATSLMDTLMLGRADSSGMLLSASSLANQPFFILSLACFGLSGAGTVFAAQYWGKRDMDSIRRIFAMIIKAAAVIAVIFGLAALIVPETLMRLYSNNDAVIAAGSQYLRIIGWAYFLFGVSNTVVCLLRSVEIVKIAVAVNLSSFVVNVFLNWVLIFGNLGAPAMGIRGAAAATLCARTLEFIIVITYVFVVDKRLGFRPKHLLLFDKELGKGIVKDGTPVFINEVMWSLAISVQAAILGHIGYADGDPVAANAVTSMVQQLATTFVLGVGSAAAVVVGKSVGEGRCNKARLQANTLYLVSIVLGIAAFGVIMLLKDPVIGFYGLPSETQNIAKQLMTATAFVSILVSVSTVSIVGILRGGGDTRFCMALELTALWCIATPAAFVAYYFFELPVVAVFLLMKSDELIKSIVAGVRIKRGKWVRDLTR